MFTFRDLNSIQQNVKVGMKETMYIVHTPKWFEEKTKYEYTVWSMIRGKAFIETNGKKFTASENDVVLFAPGIRHISYSDKDGCEFIFQQFSLEQGNNLNLLDGLNLSGIVRKEYIGEENKSYVRKIKKSSVPPYNLSLNDYAAFMSYITFVLNLVDNGKYTPFFEEASTQPKSNLRAAMTYIGTHFPNTFSMKEAARIAGLSEKYFIQQFKQSLGISPHQYLIQCRM
ncbi:MAG: AraC family transcriptional regulator [Candidatus Ornithomonoglobus sp.]